MLVVAMADLVALPPGKPGNIHPVVVDQTQSVVDDEHVAVLQVAVRNSRPVSYTHLTLPTSDLV